MSRDIPGRTTLTVDQYFEGVRTRDMSVLPRALTLVESNHPAHQHQAEELLTRLLPFTGNAIRVGISGVPGVGKSSFIDAVGMHLVEQGQSVAVFAVDPSSQISGGSILGDKTRMHRLATNSGAFIRPSPSAGTLGGVARKTREAMLVCEAAGFEVVLIETVGVGQSETMVADMTDCFLALMLPGAGDELQAVKRGLLERVDVIAVNKADGPTRKAAQLAAQQLSHALHSIAPHESDTPPVLTCSAINDEGIDRVWEVIQKRYNQLKASGELAQRHRQQNGHWLWSLVDERLRQAVRQHPQVSNLRDELEEKVLDGTLAPELAARKFLEAFGLPNGKPDQSN